MKIQRPNGNGCVATPCCAASATAAYVLCTSEFPMESMRMTGSTPCLWQVPKEARRAELSAAPIITLNKDEIDLTL